jgi:hypothetical protein
VLVWTGGVRPAAPISAPAPVPRHRSRRRAQAGHHPLCRPQRLDGAPRGPRSGRVTTAA